MNTSRPIPVLLHVATASQVAPLAAFVLARTRTRPAALLAVGAAVSLAANGIGRILASAVGNNQIVSYLATPLTAACFFWACADWQVSPREQRAVRFAVPAFLALWVILVAAVEDVRSFELVTYPFFSLSLMAIALWTLLRRSQTNEMLPLHRSDWFWAPVGLACLGASTALTNAIGATLLARARYDLFDLVWQTRSFLVALAYLLIAWGIYLAPPVSKFSTVD